MESRTNVLLIEDNPGDAILVREMLLELPSSPFAVQWADCLAKGLARLQASQVDVVILDLNLPDSAGLQTFLKLHEAAPAIPVIVLSGREDDDLALEAVRSGAEDYLIKGTVSGESLGRSIRYMIERNARQRRSQAASAPRGKAKGKILGFIGAKGGVGTTTVALNVSAGIAQSKRNVILAELRGSCGTVSHHFQRQVPPGNLSRLVNQPAALINELELNACMAKYSTGYRVLFGPQKADEAKPVPGDTARVVTHLLGSMAEFVIVDLPPDPSDSNRNAIRECDFVGLVLEREPSCLASARIMLDHINSWTTDALVALVVVHRTPLAVPMDLDHLVADLGLGIAGLIPPAPDACVLAQRAGTPVVITYADTLVGDSFAKLAAALSEDPIVIRKVA